MPRLQVAVFLLVSIALLASLGFIFWLGNIRPQPQIFAGINLMRKPIIVTIAGEQKLLNLYDTYHIVTTTKGEIELSVSDADGNPLESREYIVTATPGIGIDLFTEGEELTQCIVSANVTGSYYQLDNTQVFEISTKPTDFRILASSPTLHFYNTIDQYQSQYVFPDSYDGNRLPVHLDRTFQVFGYYPVPCADIRDEQKLTDWVSWWREYNPGQQRNLYEAELTKIKQTTFYR